MVYKVLVLSDIHSNMPALEAVLDDAISHGPYDAKVSLGDQIGYGPFPNEVLYTLRQEKFSCIGGNHEVLIRDPMMRTTNEGVQFAVDHNNEVLSDENKEYIIGLQTEPYIHDSKLFAMVHGSFSGPEFDEEQREFELIYVNNEDEVKLAMKHMIVEDKEVRVGLVGHTHFPQLSYGHLRREKEEKFLNLQSNFYGTRNNKHRALWEAKVLRLSNIHRCGSYEVEWHTKILLNPGSVGQPRDYCPKASYATLEFEDDLLTVEFHHVEYDIFAIQREMALQGFPIQLIDRLEIGR